MVKDTQDIERGEELTVMHRRADELGLALRLERWSHHDNVDDFVLAFYLEVPDDDGLMTQCCYDIVGPHEHDMVAFGCSIALEFARALIVFDGRPKDIMDFVEVGLSARIEHYNANSHRPTKSKPA